MFECKICEFEFVRRDHLVQHNASQKHQARVRELQREQEKEIQSTLLEATERATTDDQEEADRSRVPSLFLGMREPNKRYRTGSAFRGCSSFHQ